MPAASKNDLVNCLASVSSAEKKPRCLNDCVALLRSCGAAAAVLRVEELQAFWLSVMADRSVAMASRLVASKYYGDSVGAFANKNGSSAPVRVRFAAPADVVDAVVVTPAEASAASVGA